MEVQSDTVVESPPEHLYDENKRNKTSMYCPLCKSIVLKPNNATLVEKNVRVVHL